MKVACQYNKLVDHETLKAHPRNSNNHSEKQIKMLAKIIEDTGWRHPIIVSKRSKFIVAGHCRLEAALLNKYEKVPVQYQEFDSEESEFKFLIADNKIAELADHNDGFMIQQIKELNLEAIDFELLGLSDFIIEEIKAIKNTSVEFNVSEFDNFDHQCPKCRFEWNDNVKSKS